MFRFINWHLSIDTCWFMSHHCIIWIWRRIFVWSCDDQIGIKFLVQHLTTSRTHSNKLWSIGKLFSRIKFTTISENRFSICRRVSLHLIITTWTFDKWMIRKCWWFRPIRVWSIMLQTFNDTIDTIGFEPSFQFIFVQSFTPLIDFNLLFSYLVRWCCCCC